MAHLPICGTLAAALAVFSAPSYFPKHPVQPASQVTPTSPSLPRKASLRQPCRKLLVTSDLFKRRLSHHKHLICAFFFLRIIWDSCRVVVQGKSKPKWSTRSDHGSDRRSSLGSSISSSRPSQRQRKLCFSVNTAFLHHASCLHQALPYRRL